ncbi:protein-tyrosine phosphatase-like protein [Flagelloscypha sp. PMI_526]|nr:protein-tyrosine phosphatase-like protein [Flagelloscypha sp. PMI_526]
MSCVELPWMPSPTQCLTGLEHSDKDLLQLFHFHHFAHHPSTLHCPHRAGVPQAVRTLGAAALLVLLHYTTLLQLVCHLIWQMFPTSPKSSLENSTFMTSPSQRTQFHLSKYGITHILSTLSDKVKVPSGSVMKRKIDIKHKQIHIDDLPFAELIGFFPETTSFISEALAPSSLDAEKDNKVLVHCHEGISRSTSVVSAYLMQKYGMSPQEALAYVKSKRRVADPNLGFVQQLNEYRDQLAASSSSTSPASSTSHL